MKVIGLCGGSGSGKSTVAGCFLQYGIPSIDTDALYHRMTAGPSPCLSELIAAFGAQYLAPDGSLDRRKLAEEVFSGGDAEEKRKRLNEIAHRHVLAACGAIIESFREEKKAAVLVDAPLLYESGLDRACDFVIAVVADPDLRVRRIVARDGITSEQALARLHAQMPDEQLIRRADVVIRNDGDEERLRRAVERVFCEKIQIR